MNDNRYQPTWNTALVLSDGTVFRGISFGARSRIQAPIVFTTRMFGYQEACTDPAFDGKVLCMTYPVIGNYGVTPDDDLDPNHQIVGLIVREFSDFPSNWRSTGTIAEYLKERGIVGVSEIDTRALVRHIRDHGPLRVTIVPDAADFTEQELVAIGKDSAHDS